MNIMARGGAIAGKKFARWGGALLAGAAACLVVLPAKASAQVTVTSTSEDGLWAAVQTSNCILIVYAEYHPILNKYETEKQLSWSGGCNSNGLAHGSGMLTHASRFNPLNAAPYRQRTEWEVTFQNGLMEGNAIRMEYNDHSGAMTRRDDPMPEFYRNGCWYFVWPSGQIGPDVFWKNCDLTAGVAFRDKVRGNIRQATTQGVTVPAPDELTEVKARAEAGDVTAQLDLAQRLLSGIGAEQNIGEVKHWYLAAAKQGNLEGQVAYASIMFSLKEFEDSAHWFGIAAEAGHAVSQRVYGDLLLYGLGISSNGAEAVRWYRASAQQGDIDAQWALGNLYSQGFEGAQNIAVDLTEAARWFLAAAEQGNAAAQREVGALYYYGRGTPQDTQKAIHWWQMAATQGDQTAVDNLANVKRQQQAAQPGVSARNDAAENEAFGKLVTGGLIAALGGNTEQVVQAMTGLAITTAPAPQPAPGVTGGGQAVPARASSQGGGYDRNNVPYATSSVHVPVSNDKGCISSKYLRHSAGTHTFEVSSSCSTPVFYGIGPADYSQRWSASSQSERTALEYKNELVYGIIKPGEAQLVSHNQVEGNAVGQLRTPKVVLYACKKEEWASQEVGISLSHVYFDHTLNSCMGQPVIRGPSPGTAN
ncbi:MAG: hypothetical protein CVT79_14775 [Alphaproteobacteria bacterium HGW-Alphaproteobacteria-18]|nr:MAG: hypothetical protein CVT79_14775 [Alphaproteobacteria bacterium HGW-Alphaproteobacteria-18]